MWTPHCVVYIGTPLSQEWGVNNERLVGEFIDNGKVGWMHLD